MDTAFLTGYLAAGEILDAKERGKQRRDIAEETRDDIVEQLLEDGILLPPQDWGEEFEKEREEVLADWFERHPECERGTGAFGKKYQPINDAIESLNRMTRFGRISKEEYMTLYKGLFTF